MLDAAATTFTKASSSAKRLERARYSRGRDMTEAFLCD
jgi:hypothetical protein